MAPGTWFSGEIKLSLNPSRLILQPKLEESGTSLFQGFLGRDPPRPGKTRGQGDALGPSPSLSSSLSCLVSFQDYPCFDQVPNPTEGDSSHGNTSHDHGRGSHSWDSGEEPLLTHPYSLWALLLDLNCAKGFLYPLTHKRNQTSPAGNL